MLWEDGTQLQWISLHSNTWRDGTPLPAGIKTVFGQAVTASNHLFYIGKDGQVMKMSGNVWVKVTDIAGWGYRHVFPAPAVTSDVFKC